MLYYFDNSNFTDIYVRIFTDDEEQGYLYLQKNKITAVELFSGINHVRFSFSKKKPENTRKLKRVEVKKTFTIKKERLNQNYRRIHEKWQFPFDSLIETKSSKGNIYLYPANFTQKELEGGLYYKAVNDVSGQPVAMKLVKKSSTKKIENERRKKIVCYSTISLILFGILFFAIYQIFWSDISPFDKRGMSWIAIACMIGFWYSSYLAGQNVKYAGMFREAKLKEYYDVPEEGESL